MNRLRFTLTQLMALVLCLGLGLAALRNADGFWAGATYNLGIMMVATALVGAIARKGRPRATWAGFAVFGYTYLIASLADWRTGGFGFGPIPRPILLIESGITRLQPFLKPLPPGMSSSLAGNFLIPYEQVSFSLGIILFGMLGAVVGHVVAAKED
jgi:hypothetical protein